MMARLMSPWQTYYFAFKNEFPAKSPGSELSFHRHVYQIQDTQIVGRSCDVYLWRCKTLILWSIWSNMVLRATYYVEYTDLFVYIYEGSRKHKMYMGIFCV